MIANCELLEIKKRAIESDFEQLGNMPESQALAWYIPSWEPVMFDDFRHSLRLTIFAYVLIAAFGTPSLSHAQSSIPPEQAKAFVRAALAVGHVNEDWQQRINHAKSEVEAERLREQAALAMRKAIQETDGISIDTYRSIYHAARRDSELSAYLTDLLEQEVAER